MKDTLKLKIRVLAIMLVAIIFTLTCVSMLLGIRDKKIYPSNLAVNGNSLANLSKTQIVEFLQNNYAKQKLILVMPDDLIQLDLNQCGIKLNTEATLKKLEQVDNALFENITCRGGAKDIALVLKWDEILLNETLDRLVVEYSKPAVNARVIYKKHDFIRAIPHERGYQINKEELIKAVTQSLAEGHLGPITVPVEEVTPQITLYDLQQIHSLIAVTNYKNVRLNPIDEHIIAVLDNKIILSGDTLNLDELWRNEEIDVNSATIGKALKSLFNSIGTQIDFEYDLTNNTIKNNLPNPILINIYLDQDILWLSIIGNKDDVPKKVSLLTEKINIPAPITRKIDNSLPAGEQRIDKGKDTVIVKKYRVVEEAGKIVEKVLLAEEKYLGYATIIYTGPGTINK